MGWNSGWRVQRVRIRWCAGRTPAGAARGKEERGRMDKERGQREENGEGTPRERERGKGSGFLVREGVWLPCEGRDPEREREREGVFLPYFLLNLGPMSKCLLSCTFLTKVVPLREMCEPAHF